MKPVTRHVSDEKLSAFLDGDLGGRESQGLSSHLARCRACQERLQQLRQVKERLSLLGQVEPPESLWWKVRTAVNEKRAGASSWRRRRWPSYLAAFATTAAGLAWLAFVWLRSPVTDEATPAEALRAVQEAEVQYLKAIDTLAASLKNREPYQAPAVQQALAENLATIDRAIGDFRHLLRDRPDDLETQRAMLALYQRKVDLLTEIVLEAPDSP